MTVIAGLIENTMVVAVTSRQIPGVNHQGALVSINAFSVGAKVR